MVVIGYHTLTNNIANQAALHAQDDADEIVKQIEEY